MDHSATNPLWNPISHASSTFLHDFGTRADEPDAPPLPLPPAPYGQYASYPAYTTSQNGFCDPQFNHITDFSLASRGRPSLLPTAPTASPSVPVSTWNSGHPGYTGSAMQSPFPSSPDRFFYGAPQASEDRAITTSYASIPQRQDHIPEGAFPRAVAPSPQPEHVVLWYLTCWRAVVVNGPRKFVPQTIYAPQSPGDKERYVSLAKLNQPIIFVSRDSPEWGIPLSYLLSNKPIHLVGGHEPAFASCGPSIGIRVQWPGYKPCHKQVLTTDYTPARRMINKERLARIVAKSVKRFMDDMSTQAMQVGSDARWRISPSDITADDVMLVSLHHISQGSWQPHLRLLRHTEKDTGKGQQSHHGA